MNLYISMDGNCNPSAISGRVKSGISPKVEEDKIPKRNPVMVFLFMSLIIKMIWV